MPRRVGDHHDLVARFEDVGELGRLALRGATAGDVTRVGDDALDARLVEQVRGHALEDAPGAVLVQRAVLEDRRLRPRRDVRGDGLGDAIHVVGVEELAGERSVELVGCVPEDVLDRRTDVDERPLEVGDRHEIRRVLHECPEAVLARSQRRLRLEAIGDVARIDDESTHRGVVEAVHADGLVDAIRAVGMPDPIDEPAALAWDDCNPRDLGDGRLDVVLVEEVGR